MTEGEEIRTRLCTEGQPREDDHLRAKEGGLTRNQPHDALIVDFQLPGLGENTLVLFKLPKPWCSLMGAPAD